MDMDMDIMDYPLWTISNNQQKKEKSEKNRKNENNNSLEMKR